MSGADEPQDDYISHTPLHRTASGANAKPKGILKNTPASTTISAGPATPSTGQHLQWDEENIALTEIQKDSLMKITEPKTPYVRYNAETDEIEGDIPVLDLGGRAGSSYTSSPSRGNTPEASEHGSRRASFSSTGKPSASGRSGSGSSSRSTSFSLPNDVIGKELRSSFGERGEIEEEEMDEEAQAKHEAFVRARGRHYSNEAEAMKRAARLIADEDEDDKEDVHMEEDPSTEGSSRTNGIV